MWEGEVLLFELEFWKDLFCFALGLLVCLGENGSEEEKEFIDLVWLSSESGAKEL